MEEGLCPGIMAVVGELSKEGEGELGLQFLVVVGPIVFLLISGGLQQKSGIVWSQYTPVPPFSVRSGTSGVEWMLVFLVAVICYPGFPGCFPESRHWVQSWSGCNTSQSACDELCREGSARMSMSSGCFGCVVLSVSLWDVPAT